MKTSIYLIAKLVGKTAEAPFLVEAGMDNGRLWLDGVVKIPVTHCFAAVVAFCVKAAQPMVSQALLERRDKRGRRGCEEWGVRYAFMMA
jgi:hypothetical protein